MRVVHRTGPDLQHQQHLGALNLKKKKKKTESLEHSSLVKSKSVFEKYSLVIHTHIDIGRSAYLVNSVSQPHHY